ncbi:MAG: BrnT family toxin [Desulfobacterales bacterium]|nr:BrnT family toxin [Desulfobacterales bacterium]
MRISWDPQKAETNYRKHKMRFSDAESVLFDALALTREEQTVSGEQRFVTLGADALGRVLVLVYTEIQDGFRIISARRATPSERRRYEEGI